MNTIDINDMLHSQTAIGSIIRSENRHDLSNFLHAVRSLHDKEAIDEGAFKWFRNGYAIDSIFELGESNDRPLQQNELADKINYLSLIPDTLSLNATYTDRKLIQAMASGNREATYWFNSGTLHSLPIETRTRVAKELMKAGDYEKALTVLRTVEDSYDYERKQKREENQR